MKKLLATLIVAAALCGCGRKGGPVAEEEPKVLTKTATAHAATVVY